MRLRVPTIPGQMVCASIDWMQHYRTRILVSKDASLELLGKIHGTTIRSIAAESSVSASVSAAVELSRSLLRDLALCRTLWCDQKKGMLDHVACKSRRSRSSMSIRHGVLLDQDIMPTRPSMEHGVHAKVI